MYHCCMKYISTHHFSHNNEHVIYMYVYVLCFNCLFQFTCIFPAVNQQSETHHYFTVDWSLSWSHDWTSPTTTFRYVLVSSLHQHWRQCSFRCCNVWMGSRKEDLIERGFVGIRVLNPSAQSNCHGFLSSMYCKHGPEKRMLYVKVTGMGGWAYKNHSFGAVYSGWNKTCCKNIL